MSTAVAYGSITVVDVSDAKEFSVQPMSNLPLSVIYDPAGSGTYTPNWGTSNLLIPISVYYGGQELTYTDLLAHKPQNEDSVVWTKKVGTAAEAAIDGATETLVTTGANAGALSVTANKFNASGTTIMYMVKVVYLDPTLGVKLTARGQITYTLVKNASAAKNVRIIGDTVFKYDENISVQGSGIITLNAETSGGASITYWEYQKQENNAIVWDTFPNSSGQSSISINHTPPAGTSFNPFIGDKCNVRVLTSDQNVYDMHTITKLYDGVPGTDAIAVLTNDDQMIPYVWSDEQQKYVGDFSQATTQLSIFENGEDVTSQWTITPTASQVHFVAQPGSDNSIIHVDYFLTDGVGGPEYTSGTVTLTCRNGTRTRIKTFNVVRIQSGADGASPTIYSLEPSCYVINKSVSGATTTFNPNAVTFSAYQQTGDVKEAYSGAFKIYLNITKEYLDDHPSTQASEASSSNEASHPYTIPASATSILCVLYKNNSFTDVLDYQEIVVTNDGQPGPQGKSAINVVLGNYSDVISCDSKNNTIGQRIDVPYQVYEGTTPMTSVNCSVSAPTLFGQSANTDTFGMITWIIPSGRAASQTNGSVTIQFTITPPSGGAALQVLENYTWSRSSAVAPTVLLQIYTPDGTDVFSTGVTSLKLKGVLMSGSKNVRSSVTTWQWAKWQYNSSADQWGYLPVTNKSGEYAGQGTDELTVYNTTVDSYASFQLTATYDSVPYYAYYSVFDKTDPIQVSVLSTVGTQLLNGQGYGVVYVIVTKNGDEIDALKSSRFLEAEPTSPTPTAGDFYYLVDKTNKRVKLMRYSGSAWEDVTSNSLYAYQGTYTWSWMDKNANAVTTVGGYALPTTGKVIYIDGDMVDQKIIGNVGVSI